MWEADGVLAGPHRSGVRDLRSARVIEPALGVVGKEGGGVTPDRL